MILNLVSDALDFPVTAIESALDLRISDTSEHPYLDSLIKGAAAYAGGRDGIVGKSITTQVWSLKLNNFYNVINLPMSPVKSVNSISYFDETNNTQVFDPTKYLLYADEDNACIQIKQGEVFPNVAVRQDAVEIQFTTGYTIVPENINRAIRMLVAHWYEIRYEMVLGLSVSQVPHAVDELLAISRSGWVA